jgi:hypothetical protein
MNTDQELSESEWCFLMPSHLFFPSKETTIDETYCLKMLRDISVDLPRIYCTVHGVRVTSLFALLAALTPKNSSSLSLSKTLACCCQSILVPVLHDVMALFPSDVYLGEQRPTGKTIPGSTEDARSMVVRITSEIQIKKSIRAFRITKDGQAETLSVVSIVVNIPLIFEEQEESKFVEVQVTITPLLSTPQWGRRLSNL